MTPKQFQKQVEAIVKKFEKECALLTKEYNDKIFAVRGQAEKSRIAYLQKQLKKRTAKK